MTKKEGGLALLPGVILNDILSGDNSDKISLIIEDGNKILVQHLVNQILHVRIRRYRLIIRPSWNLRDADALRILSG